MPHEQEISVTLVEKRVGSILNKGESLFNGIEGFADIFNVLFPQNSSNFVYGAMDEGEVSLGI